MGSDCSGSGNPAEVDRRTSWPLSEPLAVVLVQGRKPKSYPGKSILEAAQVVSAGWHFEAAPGWIQEGCFLGGTVAAAEMFSWEALLASVTLPLVEEMEHCVSLETEEAREAAVYKCAAEEYITLGLRWDSGLRHLRPGKMIRRHHPRRRQ